MLAGYFYWCPMTIKIMRISDWNSHFENNRTRELKRIDWIPVPNKHDGDGYTELLDHPDGTAHYGAWHLILQVASKCEPRGTLLREGAGRCGIPHDARSIARITRGNEKVISEAIERLISIGWIETYEESRQNPAPSCEKVPMEWNGMEWNGIEREDAVVLSKRKELFPDHFDAITFLRSGDPNRNIYPHVCWKGVEDGAIVGQLRNWPKDIWMSSIENLLNGIHGTNVSSPINCLKRYLENYGIDRTKKGDSNGSVHQARSTSGNNQRSGEIPYANKNKPRIF